MALYGISEQRDAQRYIRQRMESEYSMVADLDDLIGSFVRLYLDMLYSGATQDQLDALIDDLALQLLDDCETLAVDEHEKNRDEILLFILGDVNGRTLREKVTERCRTLANELFLVFVLGQLLGKSRDLVLSSILSNLQQPYSNPIILEARDKVARGEITSPVSLEEPHYGRGVAVSSRIALEALLTNAVVGGWGMNDYLEHKDSSVGYVVQRGSSYPCDLCDSYVGYHDIADTDSLPMYHSHCRCFVIWVKREDVL